MDISKLLHKRTFIADIKIIVALLPEMLRLADQSSRYPLLQRFQRVGERALPRLGKQQVNVLGHHYIAVDAESETASHTLQRSLEHLFGDRSRE